MATGFNTSYYFEEAQALSRHSISFDSSAVNNSWDMISKGNQYGMSGLSSMITPRSLNSAALSDSGISQGRTSSGSFVSDGILGLKHDTGLAVEWSVEEQYMLEMSIDKNKSDPNMINYIRIASNLPEKTVRDVALRCRWMARKRRKQEEHYSGKKVTSRKDKSVESCPKLSLTSAQPFNIRTHSPPMQQIGLDQSDASNDAVKQFLQQNFDTFDQISANMSTYKFQENIELFCRAKSNISAALNEMVQLPGLPRFPISIDEDFINSLLSDTNQYLHTPDGLAKWRSSKTGAKITRG